MPVVKIMAPELSLAHTLESGQTFCWCRDGDGPIWRGWIGGKPCRVWKEEDCLCVEGRGIGEGEVIRYFSLDLDWEGIFAGFSEDSYLREAFEGVRGLRIVREPWWECVVNFICSSLKQIVQIQQINRNLREAFGEKVGGGWPGSFPSPSVMASVSEEALRACRLGYRARHLFHASRQVAREEFSWEALERMDTVDAEAELRKLAGVGSKVAKCVLLYAGNRYDAFPLDVWMVRLIHELYFPKRRKPLSMSGMEAFAQKRFGETRGIAQLYLFHWYRTVKTSRFPETKINKGKGLKTINSNEFEV